MNSNVIENQAQNLVVVDNQVTAKSVALLEPQSKEYQLIKGYSLAKVSTEELEIEYIAGMFPKGKVSGLVGESGKGKGWVLPAVALTITDAKEFLPTEDYELKDTGRVLIIDTESRIKTYARRIKEMGGDLEKYMTASDPLSVLGFQNPDDRKLIEDVIEQDKPELVIVDSFAGFSAVDENSCQVLPSLKWFGELALKYNVALVFTQLVNKSNLQDGRLTTKSIRGFSGIYQFAEIIIEASFICLFF